MPFDDLALLYNSPPLPVPDARCHYWEVYSPPRVCPFVRAEGGRAKRSIDKGNFWDLNQAPVQHTLLHDLMMLRPFCCALSPPCTYLSSLNFSNWGKMCPVGRDTKLREAILHVDVSMWIAEFQAKHDAYFVFEHPAGAQTWHRNNATASVHFQT
jgi:hypothetical protein